MTHVPAVCLSAHFEICFIARYKHIRERTRATLWVQFKAINASYIAHSIVLGMNDVVDSVEGYWFCNFCLMFGVEMSNNYVRISPKHNNFRSNSYAFNFQLCLFCMHLRISIWNLEIPISINSNIYAKQNVVYRKSYQRVWINHKWT